MDNEDVRIEEDEALGDFLPGGFGKQTREANIAAQIEQTRRTVGQPTKKVDTGGNSDDSDDDQSDEEDEFPVSHEIVFRSHEKPVTSISLDASGARFVTGSKDCTFKLHDFASLTPTTLRAFKSVDPTETKTSASQEVHPVHHVEFNPLAPAQVLVISATPQAKIFSRDGDELTQFVKGDMYLRDMNNTKGHVSEITTGTWHPTKRELLVTAGTDSTLRIWDAQTKRSQRDVIVFKSKAVGSAGRSRMTAVSWKAGILVAAAFDGSLVMWGVDGPYNRPSGEVRDAHARDTWTGGLDISSDGRTIVTRGGDNTIKLWDTRKFKQPVSTVEHLSTTDIYPTTNIRFSSNSSSIITGSATGDLHILNPATLRPEMVTPITPNSPLVTVEWHDKLNQILTGSANAETHVLYNPTTSSRGAVAVMSKVPKRRHIDDDPNLTTDIAEGMSGDSMINPGGGLQQGPRNPTIGLTASGKSRDPRRPHIPMTTPFAKSTQDEDSIKRNIPLSSMRDEDPREALLKYAAKAKDDPMFTNAWKETQPVTKYSELSDEEEEPDKKRQRR
jgi:WD40 repeat protein